MTASAELVRRVADRLGDPVYNPPGHRTIGRVLDVHYTQVGPLLAGTAIMSRHAFAHAARFLELPPGEVLEYSARLQAEGIKDSDTREWFVRQVAEVTRRAGAYVLAVLAVTLAAFASPLEARASTHYETPRGHNSLSVYTLCEVAAAFLRALLAGRNFETKYCSARLAP